MFKLSKKIIGLFVLSFIGLLLGVFYYNFLHKIIFYFVGYFQYYSESYMLFHFLSNLDFSSFFDVFLRTYADKLLYLRVVPFFLLFGVSKFLFSFSSFVLNFVFLLCLFYLLTRFLSVGRAFLFSLLVLSSSFFLELAGLFYVDLHFFFACSFFFILLFLFKDNQKTYFIPLTISVFLLFLAKNTTYIFLLLIVLCISIYFLIKDKMNIKRTSLLVLVAIIGFIIYFSLFLNFSSWYLNEDLNGGAGYFLEETNTPTPTSFIVFFDRVFNFFVEKDFSFNLFFLDKFSTLWLNILLYCLVFYYLFKKKHLFWVFLFFIGELFFIILFNVIGFHHEYRYMFPFYFVYLLLMFYFITEIAKTYFKKKYYIPIIMTIILLLTINMNNLINLHLNNMEYTWSPKATGKVLDMIYELPPGIIYISKATCPMFFAVVHSYMYDEDFYGKYKFVADSDYRFSYKLVNIQNETIINSGNYVLTFNYNNFNISGYEFNDSYSGFNFFDCEDTFYLFKKK